MNNKHLLSTCITLLYLRSRMEHRSSSGVGLVTQALELIKMPELATGTVDRERETITCLTRTARAMMADEEGINKTTLVSQLTLDCGQDQSLLDSMRCIIEAELEPDEVAQAVVSFERSLNKLLREDKVTNMLFDMARRMKFQPDGIEDKQKYLLDIVGSLEPYTTGGGGEDPGILADFDLEDSAAVEEVFEQAKKNEDGTGSFIFGFKHINKFFNGKLPPGKFVLVGALMHQHKTGFTLALFRHAAIYNSPHLREGEENRKPLLLRISAEDEVADNLRKIFTDTYYNIEKTVPNFMDFSTEYMRGYIHEKWSATGWKIRFMRINPSAWSYRHIEQKIIELESQGYVVKLCMLDYLMMIPTTGCEKGATGEDKRDLVRRVRNFMSA